MPSSLSFLPRRWSRAPSALAPLLLLLAPACKLISSAANAPGNVAAGLTGGNSKPPPDKIPATILQLGIMRFADTFTSRVNEATQDFAEKAATPEARIQGLNWSIKQCTSAITIAAGPNATVAMLDMIVLVTLGRMVHEEYLLPKVWGEADRPMVEAFRALEERIWTIASQTLSPEQQDELRATLREWRDQNPNLSSTAFVRLPAFQDIFVTRNDEKKEKKNGLGDLLSVDPLSGLEPAVREIEKTRLFAERTMFYVQRAPILLSMQIELLGKTFADMPEVHSALGDSQRISEAAASIAETAAKLPAFVQAQREGLIADLEKAEEPTRKILTDARATLEAGTQLSTSLQATIGTVDTFLAQFAAKEPPPGAPPPPPAEPSKPFDIVEYGQAAEKIGGMVRDLNGVVTSLDQSLPKVQRVMNEATDRAFGRGIALGVVLIAAAALATLGVRWISARFIPPRARQASG